MAGKREKKRNRLRLPGVLALLAALTVLLSPAGPAGVAADSPVERPASRAAVAELPELPVPQMPETVLPAAELPGANEAPAVDAPPETPWTPVPESTAVEDTYFSDVVFLGDSRTEGLSLYGGLEEARYLFGVGATVESVFSKNAWETESGKKVPLLDALAEMECGKVYVMLGVNELGWNKVETFTGQYAKVIDRIREDHPGVRVVLQSIMPVSAKQEAKKSYVNNTRIQAYNEAIVALAEEKNCDFVNVAEAVTGEDGCLRPELTGDGVHLNVKGCGVWLDYLRTHSV